MRVALAVVLLTLGFGCGTPMKPQVCVPGKSEACVGAGGCPGGQQCNADGTGFGSCDCTSTGTGGGGATGGGTGGGATGGGTGGGAMGGGTGGGAMGGGQGGGGGEVDSGIDAGIDAGLDAGFDAGFDAGIPDAGPPPCDPTPTDGGGTGCPSGQRCTWVALTMTTGVSTCVPMGTVAVGGTCMPANPLLSGYDECVAGSVCIGTTCTQTCSLNIPTSCGAGATCVAYSGLFANEPDAPATGACVATCDPLAMMPCPTAGQGCYLLTSSTTTTSVCAGAGTVMHGQTITGTSFANSCVPGAMPRKIFGTNTNECGGLCRPAEVTMGVNVSSEGGVTPNSCQVRWGAAAPSDVMAGESCRYFWAREPFDALSPFSNTLGFCFKHAAASYDSNGDMTPDAPFPRCTTLTTGDVLPPISNPAGNDALSFWCVEKPAMKRAERMEKQPASWVPRLTGWR